MPFMPIAGAYNTGLQGMGNKTPTPFSFPISSPGISSASPIGNASFNPDMQKKWQEFLTQQLLSQIGLNKMSAQDTKSQIPLASEQTPQPSIAEEKPNTGVYQPEFPDTGSLAWNRPGYPENYPNVVHTGNLAAEQAPPPDYPAPPGTQWVFNYIPGQASPGRTGGYWYLIGTPT